MLQQVDSVSLPEHLYSDQVRSMVVIDDNQGKAMARCRFGGGGLLEVMVIVVGDDSFGDDYLVG